jgi:hypothetical protein
MAHVRPEVYTSTSGRGQGDEALTTTSTDSPNLRGKTIVSNTVPNSNTGTITIRGRGMSAIGEVREYRELTGSWPKAIRSMVDIKARLGYALWDAAGVIKRAGDKILSEPTAEH